LTAARWLIVPVVALAIAGTRVLMDHGKRSATPVAAPRVVTPRTPRAIPTGELPALGRATAIRAARRFASAYGRWDAGARDARTRRRLATSATRDLRAELSGAVARPVAGTAGPLNLAVTAANRIAGGYAVALGQRRTAGSHVVTVVVVATPEGPRVDRIER
jgi:hypothetical protein